MKDARQPLITLAKIFGSLALIGLLCYLAVNTEEKRRTFFDMLTRQKTWSLLVAGFVVLLLAILITMIRWRYLVCALGIDFSVRDALRIGFIGYLINLAPMGIVGGDLVKALMLAKENSCNRAKALASVVVDRIIGLYVLFLVASAGVFISGLWQYENANIHAVCVAVFIATAVSTVGIALVLTPGVLEGRFVRALTRIPKVGHAIASLLDALMIYRERRVVLFWTSVATIPVHSFLTISVFLLALGLGFKEVSCRDFFGIYPISGILSTIPLPAGPQETGIVFLYKRVWMHEVEGGNAMKPSSANRESTSERDAAQQQGLILALVYRLTTILIAPIGAAYYFLGARGEVSEVMHDIEDEKESQSPG